LHRQ